MSKFIEEATNMAKMMDPNGFELSDQDVALHWAVLLNDSPISDIKVDSDELIISFENGRSLKLEDTQQSCCENRYMSSDDDLKSLIGAKLAHIEVVAADDVVKDEDSYGDHEQMFLKIRTTNGDMTVVTHNEHNGYYGGFSIEASWKDAVPAKKELVE